MSNTESINVYTSVPLMAEGSPIVLVNSGNPLELQIYPTGDGVVLFMSPEHWRTLNAAVETAIANHVAAEGVRA